MSWMEELIKTYDVNAKIAGDFNATGQKYVLAPIGHMTVSAQIEITLDGDGNLLQAAVVPKEDKETLIPCTPASASRTSKPEPHPLHDNLQYVARDYDDYSDKQLKDSKEATPYMQYKKLLERWCCSPYRHRKIQAVYNYISQHNMIQDLIDHHILFVTHAGVMQKWEGDSKEKPEIFTVVTGDILKSFVRFKVDLQDGSTTSLWQDREIQRAFIGFYESLSGAKKNLCYATGQWMLSTDKHYKGIRFSGDGAKLISSNDTSGYTFRGRFVDGQECVTLGYESSQKAMNTLKWLIRNQGYSYQGKVFLAWGNDADIPPLMGDSVDVADRRHSSQTLRAQTMQSFAAQFRQAIAGYKANLHASVDTVKVMVLDAATPGRLSICFYQEMLANDFVQRIEQWHERGKWRQYKFSGEKGVPGFFYEGVVTPRHLIEACYGDNVGESKARAAIERIFHCIINGNCVPHDMVETIVKRVITQAIKTVGNDFYAWEQLLQVACSMIRNYYYQREVYNVALDSTITDRSYLFGRLLAVADWVERSTFEKGTDRLTNAVRYMNAFSQRPSKTWVTIYNKLQPYQAKLGNKGRYKAAIIDEIVANFEVEEFASNKPLDSKFLLGYHSQRYAFQEEIKELAKIKKERESTKNADTISSEEE